MAFVDEETNVGGGNTATVLVPAAAAAGDRLLIQLTMTSDVSTSATAGLTQIGLSSPSTAGTGFMEHWTGVVTSGGVLDPGDTISIPLTSNAPWSIICAAYDPADVLGFFSNYAANANDSTVTTPSGTTLGPCIATHWYGVISNLPGITTPITWTDHASTTKRAEVCNLLATGGNFREGLGMMADEVIASAGAVAGRLATPSELVRGQGVLILLGTTVDQPVANAGTDDSMAAGATEALNGTMSDGGGAGGPYTPLTWRIISDTSGGASLSSTSVEDPDLTAGPNGGTIVLGFKGEDSAGIESDEDTVTITVVGAEDTAVPNADGTVTGWIPSTGTDIYPLLAEQRRHLRNESGHADGAPPAAPAVADQPVRAGRRSRVQLPRIAGERLVRFGGGEADRGRVDDHRDLGPGLDRRRFGAAGQPGAHACRDRVDHRRGRPRRVRRSDGGALMAEVRVHEMVLARTETAASGTRVRVHEMSLVRTPAPAPPAVVRVHGMWLTRNQAAPSLDGGIFAVDANGVWVEADILGISNGQWA